ncbi:MFS transporter [Sphaerisporangium rufum]|uniref:MFS transporter n=1 Tax=Sphaerisporangium rufum TaxID=1381558 RepID=A0A919V626_9ACTN|nr:MFS transporter [Sphaerisporangium rufum]GII78930.1 MFS transporter [Sphaerisporangium rufum]
MDRSLRAARLATFAYFAVNGCLLGMWVVHIPGIELRAGIDHAVLGPLLLLLGAGAVAGMRAVGPLTDRFGPRVVVPVAAALCCAAAVLPGLSVSGWTLGAALLVFGLGNGCLDVSMNAHAVLVERGYRRPVMSAFHAVFSLGGLLASLVAARTLSWGWSPATTLSVTAAAGLVVTLAAARALLPGGGTGAPPAAGGGRRRPPRRIWALAALALMIMMCEGVANDWSALHLRRVLEAPEATAALAFGAFSTAMTAGRLVADRVTGRFGPVAVVRYGAAAAAAGLAAAALSPWVAPALAGWAVFGAGLAGCVPQLFSAAGHADPAAAAVNVSRVAGLGYLGMLAGPAVIGPLTHLMPLNLTFFLPVALCATAAVAAGVLRPAPAGAPRPAAETV